MGLTTISHEEYLRRQLDSKKMKLEAIQIKHQIEMAVYDSEVRMLRQQINSIEKQLDDHKEPNS